jgi:hypothetical protein
MRPVDQAREKQVKHTHHVRAANKLGRELEVVTMGTPDAQLQA